MTGLDHHPFALQTVECSAASRSSTSDFLTCRLHVPGEGIVKLMSPRRFLPEARLEFPPSAATRRRLPVSESSLPAAVESGTGAVFRPRKCIHPCSGCPDSRCFNGAAVFRIKGGAKLGHLGERVRLRKAAVSGAWPDTWRIICAKRWHRHLSVKIMKTWRVHRLTETIRDSR